ncbi:hypothetical protein BDQ12DRAFT_670822 [Crucibulum laeve]|uniref:Uncharacterized protein n=1 Tax=Crucibulum laeve TaxID=68775 RepID=A0A5C3LKG3_9AGAR|nr:hypothetical protein BDQ12DRAFT_670822 [Crucibulum laeve]
MSSPYATGGPDFIPYYHEHPPLSGNNATYQVSYERGASPISPVSIPQPLKHLTVQTKDLPPSIPAFPKRPTIHISPSSSTRLDEQESPEQKNEPYNSAMQSLVGYKLEISTEMRNDKRSERAWTTVEVPLTESLNDQEKLVAQASQFLSAFSEEKSTWEIDVKNIPDRQGKVIYGVSKNSRDTAIVGRFLRFRFPLVKFEWHIESPYSEVNKLLARSKQDVQIEFLWKAWARGGASPNLVAYGTCKDTLIVTNSGELVIKKRKFIIMSVLRPELMTPIPYALHTPEYETRHSFFIFFSSSQAIIQSLRSSQRTMTSLAALSALLASLKPLVDRSSTTAGLVLAGIGITAATISVFSVVVDWMLKWIEANAAKNRQLE